MVGQVVSIPWEFQALPRDDYPVKYWTFRELKEDGDSNDY